MISRIRSISRNRLRAISVAGLCLLAAVSAQAPVVHAAPFGPAPMSVSAAVVSAAEALEQAAQAQELEQAVRGWIEALSAQKPFAEWKQAAPSIEALGPGTHGWLVTMRLSSGKPVGYMVVYAAEDGTYRLGEYGSGPQPLFDSAALSRSLVANGLISTSTPAFKAEKLYLHPFAAVWRVQVNGQTYWLDAKTDEMLPLDDEEWNLLAQAASAKSYAPFPAQPGNGEKLADVKLNEAFDPFERLPWLMNEKPFSASNEKTLLGWLQQCKQLRYVTEPFGDRMLYALAVVGYGRWPGGRIDIALDNEGTRFVPLSALRAAGLFYK